MKKICVELHFHDDAHGWVVYPAGTAVKELNINTLSSREQKIFRNILTNTSLTLVELGNRPRAIDKNIIKATTNMIDVTPLETESLKKAAKAFGEYVESIGKTELRIFSLEEFMTLLKVTIAAYMEEKAHLDRLPNFNDDLPF